MPRTQYLTACRRRCRAFTRRELMAVLFMLGLLAFLGIPWLLSRREESRRLACERNLIALNKGALAYETQFHQFPGYCERTGPSASTPAAAMSWAQALVPFVLPNPERAVPPVDQLHDPQAWPFLPTFACPDYVPQDFSAAHGWLGYVANTGLPDAPSTATLPADWPANGVLLDMAHEPRPPEIKATLQDIENGDGAQFTLLFSENVDAGYLTDISEAQIGFLWVPHLVRGLPDPGRELCRLNAERGAGDGSLRFARPSSFHFRGVNAVYVSGRTEFLPNNLDYLVFCQLMSSNGALVAEPGSEKPLPPPFRTPPPVDDDDSAPATPTAPARE